MEDNKRIYESMSSDEISAAYNSLEGKSELVKKEVAELRGLKMRAFGNVLNGIFQNRVQGGCKAL